MVRRSRLLGTYRGIMASPAASFAHPVNAWFSMGGFDEGGEAFTEQSWLRLPKGVTSKAVAGSEGATVWIKRNHLAAAPMAPAV